MSVRTWSDSRKPSSSRSTPNLPQQLHIGDKVQVNSHHGTIRYIGETKFKPGTWAGIELDAVGLGKNDGSVDGHRYFNCPPNTGLFILAIKVIKGQQLHNRPSTPHRSNSTKLQSSPPIRLLPPLPKKVILSHQDNELSLLKKRIDALESENKILKDINASSSSRILFLEQTVIDVKKAGMDSIEILESMVQSHQSQLAVQSSTIHNLQLEQNDLRLAGLEAIESYESTLQDLQNHEINASRNHHHQIKLLLQDINLLENVLENKMEKQLDLVKSLKRERQLNSRLASEVKSLKYQLKINNDNRWSFMRLDTPIEEEEDLSCALCEKQGHDLIHCSLIVNNQPSCLS
ncbi:hypothetical protein INT47_003210 [Mucor saturninus]|uniref:CAP-Gly domain-containing protein n=1 Tax=Mucor saturninus TaxID=64648 RepID=A0A8H7RH00_9FUNG|nr:hypothetical protein INT47_003210 [Mucor saturninus]